MSDDPMTHVKRWQSMLVLLVLPVFVVLNTLVACGVWVTARRGR